MLSLAPPAVVVMDAFRFTTVLLKVQSEHAPGNVTVPLKSYLANPKNEPPKQVFGPGSQILEYG